MLNKFCYLIAALPVTIEPFVVFIQIYRVFAYTVYLPVQWPMPFTCKYTKYAKTPYICMYTTNGSTVTGH